MSIRVVALVGALLPACVPGQAVTPDQETQAGPLTQKQKRKQSKAAEAELQNVYRKWVNRDVVYIITDAERTAFTRLHNDEERDQFIEQFWLRRDPTPDTEENEYKEEHYRRLAYANEHFASGIPGWKTDRGRIYIVYGPPDEIESHASGGAYQETPEEGGGNMTTYPFERWRYRYLENVGTNVVIEFVDATMTGEYHITIDPQEKNALAHVPGGASNSLLPPGTVNSKEFDDLERLSNLYRPPAVKFTDLEAVVDSKIKYNVLPMKLRVDLIPLTGSSVLTNIGLQFENRDLGFVSQGGVQRATVNLYARITTISRRVVTWFEDTVSVDDAGSRLSVYQKSIPLAPGTYRLNVVCKDVATGAVNHYETALTVPLLDAKKLGASSLIVADRIEKVSARETGMGQFVIGDSRVRPRVDSTFQRTESLGIYLQVFNFALSTDTHEIGGKIEYEVTKRGTNERVMSFTEKVGQRSTQVTVEKLLALRTLKPGDYVLRVHVVDEVGHQELSPETTFTVI